MDSPQPNEPPSGSCSRRHANGMPPRPLVALSEVQVPRDLPQIKNHSATAYGNKIYIFGGYDGKTNHRTLWELDVTAMKWAQVRPEGQAPEGRNGHTATLVGHQMWILGGWLGKGPYAANDLHVLNLEAMMWETPRTTGTPPGPCNMHTADYACGLLFVFRGGDGKDYFNDVTALDFATMNWTVIAGTGTHPPPRANHASAVHGDSLYIFGGWDGHKRLNDLYRLHVPTLTWTSPEVGGSIPAPRAGMSLTACRGLLYLYGGSGNATRCFSDCHVFDPESSSWSQPKVAKQSHKPEKRAGHAAAALDRKLFIFGGSLGLSYFRDAFYVDTDPAPLPVSLLSNRGTRGRKGSRDCRTRDKEKTKIQVPAATGILLKKLKASLEDPEYTDVTFRVAGERIRAHRQILCLLSEKFEALFSSGMRESREGEIEIPGVRPCVFRTLLGFLYCGSLDLSHLHDRWRAPCATCLEQRAAVLRRAGLGSPGSCLARWTEKLRGGGEGRGSGSGRNWLITDSPSRALAGLAGVLGGSPSAPDGSRGSLSRNGETQRGGRRRQSDEGRSESSSGGSRGEDGGSSSSSSSCSFGRRRRGDGGGGWSSEDEEDDEVVKGFGFSDSQGSGSDGVGGRGEGDASGGSSGGERRRKSRKHRRRGRRRRRREKKWKSGEEEGMSDPLLSSEDDEKGPSVPARSLSMALVKGGWDSRVLPLCLAGCADVVGCGNPECNGGLGTLDDEGLRFLIELMEVGDQFLLDSVRDQCELLLLPYVNGATCDALMDSAEGSQAARLSAYCKWVRRQEDARARAARDAIERDEQQSLIVNAMAAVSSRVSSCSGSATTSNRLGVRPLSPVCEESDHSDIYPPRGPSTRSVTGRPRSVSCTVEKPSASIPTLAAAGRKESSPAAIAQETKTEGAETAVPTRTAVANTPTEAMGEELEEKEVTGEEEAESLPDIEGLPLPFVVKKAASAPESVLSLSMSFLDYRGDPSGDDGHPQPLWHSATVDGAAQEAAEGEGEGGLSARFEMREEEGGLMGEKREKTGVTEREGEEVHQTAPGEDGQDLLSPSAPSPSAVIPTISVSTALQTQGPPPLGPERSLQQTGSQTVPPPPPLREEKSGQEKKEAVLQKTWRSETDDCRREREDASSSCCQIVVHRERQQQRRLSVQQGLRGRIASMDGQAGIERRLQYPSPVLTASSSFKGGHSMPPISPKGFLLPVSTVTSPPRLFRHASTPTGTATGGRPPMRSPGLPPARADVLSPSRLSAGLPTPLEEGEEGEDASAAACMYCHFEQSEDVAQELKEREGQSCTTATYKSPPLNAAAVSPLSVSAPCPPAAWSDGSQKVHGMVHPCRSGVGLAKRCGAGGVDREALRRKRQEALERASTAELCECCRHEQETLKKS